METNSWLQIEVTNSENKQAKSRIQVLTAELEDTKQSLEKAREENNLMTYCIKSLREELDHTKKEMKMLKAREFQKQNLKSIENPNKVKIKMQSNENKEFEKKRYVKFASPRSLAKIIVNRDEFIERPSPLKQTKSKSLAPLVKWLFAKRK